MRKEALKPFTYGLMHLVVAITVAFALTGNLAIALGIGLVEPLVQTVAYTFHEKAWAAHLRKKTPQKPGTYFGHTHPKLGITTESGSA